MIDFGTLTPVKTAFLTFAMITLLAVVEVFVPTPTIKQINKIESDIRELDRRTTELETTQRCRVNYDRMHKV